MMQFAVCTSIYEAGRPFLSDWIDAAVSAGRGHEVCAVVAVDGLIAPEAALARLRDAMPVFTRDAAPGASPAAVRGTMLAEAMQSGALHLVFCDMDDRLRSDALDRHGDALETAEISYGDLQPVTEAGIPTGASFYSGTDVPNRIDAADDILDRNWLGFSNTAVAARAIPAATLDVPAEVIAADWWFYTILLRAGLSAARAPGTVAEYRCYTGNTLGPRGVADIDGLRKRCEVVRRHHKALAGDPRSKDRLSRVERLAAVLESDPQSLQAAISRLGERQRVWHEDVALLVEHLFADATDHVDS